MECPICLTPPRIPLVLPCGHSLCVPCFLRWPHSCPLCRAPVSRLLLRRTREQKLAAAARALQGCNAGLLVGFALALSLTGGAAAAVGVVTASLGTLAASALAEKAARTAAALQRAEAIETRAAETRARNGF